MRKIKRKIPLALVCLLILTVTLMTSFFVQQPISSPPPTPEPGPGDVWHWKIELAQKKCDANITGVLLDEGGFPISGTEFDLECNQNFVFWKVNTTTVPSAIQFLLTTDWNKDGVVDEMMNVTEPLTPPAGDYQTTWLQFLKNQTLVLEDLSDQPFPITEPICNYWQEVSMLQELWINDIFVDEWDLTDPLREYHLSSWEDSGYPTGELSFCDQVDLTVNFGTSGDGLFPVSWWHVKEVIPGPPHILILERMVAVEVHHQPYDEEHPFFNWQLTIKQHNCEAEWIGFLTRDGDYIPGTDFDIYCNRTMQCTVVQTPWCTVPNDIDSEVLISGMPVPISFVEPITQFPWANTTILGLGINFTLELTEVQMHRYIVAGGTLDTAGQLGAFPPWPLEGWKTNEGVPFATREPFLKANCMWQNITFTQKDPITGIVKLGIPAESFRGLDHTFYDPRIGAYVRWIISMEEQGCGWIFTGEGKNPILGDVDLITFNNNTGVYSLKPWYEGVPMTPEPCLQNLRGLDGIPGTADDPIGDSEPDPKGSSILYVPAELNVTYWDGFDWQLLCVTPFPMFMTTGTAYDNVNESSSLINGVWAEEEGHPWRYHFDCLHWKHPECNIKVTYVCVWSKLQIPTALGSLDLLWEVMEYKIREDRYKILQGDSNWDQIVDFKDLYRVARAYGSIDEGFNYPVADDEYDARCDSNCDGIIDLPDVVVVAKNYDFEPGYHIPDTWQGTISVVPSSIVANVGNKFEVNVTVSGVTNLYLAVFSMRWNPAVLNLTKDPTVGPFIPTALPSVIASINRTEGVLEAWTGTMLAAGPGVSGTGTIATCEFEVISLGSSPLDLAHCSWMNSSLGQYGFVTVQNGSFSTPSGCVYPITFKWLNYTEGVFYDYNVTVKVAISNCCQAIQNFNFNRSLGQISFNITSATPGSCNVTVPKPLMDGGFKVLINNTQIPSMLTWNTSHTFVCFNHSQGTHNIKILGEIVTRIRDGPGDLIIADVNGDKIVDIVDIVVVALRFGWEEDS